MPSLTHCERVYELKQLTDQHTSELHASHSLPTTQQCYSRIFGSLRRKVALRGGIAIALLSSMIFIPAITDVAGSRITLLPILAFYFAKRPFTASSVGTQLMICVNGSLAIAFTVVFSLFVAWASRNSLFGLIALYFLINLFCFTIGSFTPSMRLPSAFIIVLIASMLPKYYALFHYANVSDAQAWQEIYADVGRVVFVAVVAISVHTGLALICFPWFVSECSFVQLKETYVDLAKFAEILAGRSDEELELGKAWVGGSKVEQLRILMESVESRYAKVYSGLYQVLLETRWSFSGVGLRTTQACFELREVIRPFRMITNELCLISLPELQREKEAAGTELQNEERQVALLLGKIFSAISHYLGDTALLLNSPSRESSPKAAAESPPERVLEVVASIEDCDKLMKEIESVIAKMPKAQLERGATASGNEELHGRNVYNRIAVAALACLNILNTLPECRRTIDELNRAKERKQWFTTLVDWSPTVYGSCRCCISEEDNAFSAVGFKGQPQSFFVEQNATSLERIYTKLALLFSSTEFKNGMKTAIGSTLLFLLAVLPQTYERYTDVALSNALMTFQSALRQFHLGLVFNRAINRMLGVLAGYVLASIAWTLVGDALNGWALWLLNLPFQGILVYMSSEKPLIAYIFYGLNKEMITISSVEFHSTTGEGIFAPSDQTIWERGGYIVGFTIFGSVLAFLFGACLWPSTGASKLRSLISFLLRDLSSQYEHQLLYGTMTTDAAKKRLAATIESCDAFIEYRLYYLTRPLLTAASLEILRLKFAVSLDKYEKALRAVKGLHNAMWKLRLLQQRLQADVSPPGTLSIADTAQPSNSGVVKAEGSQIDEETRIIFSDSLRAVPSALLLLSSSLEHGTPFPAIRPLISRPPLFLSQLSIYQRSLANDGAFVKVLNPWIGVLKLGLADISYEIEELFAFVSNFVPRSDYEAKFGGLEKALYHKSQLSS